MGSINGGVKSVCERSITYGRRSARGAQRITYLRAFRLPPSHRKHSFPFKAEVNGMKMGVGKKLWDK